MIMSRGDMGMIKMIVRSVSCVISHFIVVLSYHVVRVIELEFCMWKKNSSSCERK